MISSASNVRFAPDSDLSVSIPLLTTAPYTATTRALQPGRVTNVQKEREDALRSWFAESCPGVTPDRADTYSQALYRSTYDTIPRIAKKLARSGVAWLTGDVKVDVLDADEMANAMRADGLLLLEEPPPAATTDTTVPTKAADKRKNGKKQSAAAAPGGNEDVAGALGVVDSTPTLTPEQLLQREQEEALSKWLLLNCG